MLAILLMVALLPILIHSRMNVLFLVSDDMRPEIGAYQGPDFPSPVHPRMYTPNLDALAARSLLLKRAYVQQAVCSPSRTSLLTGRRPDTTHIYDLVHYFRDKGGNFTTIPQYFKQNGYMSVGMGKIFHNGTASGYDDPISWSVPYYRPPNWVYWRLSKHTSWLEVPQEDYKENPLPDMQTMRHARKTLRQIAPAAIAGKQPFFLGVGFHKPHLPFVVPKKYFKYYPRSTIRLPDNSYAPVGMPGIAWSAYGELRSYQDIKKLNNTGAINTTLPDDTVLDLRRAYYSGITYIDDLIGILLRDLDDLGLSNNTIVSFWGDHGWQLGEHGEWCKHTNFELATHAPMMIHIPGLTDKGIATDQPTEFVDLFPTLVDASELPPMPLCPEDSSKVALCREGSSLMPLIKNPRASWKQYAFSQYPRGGSHMGYTVRDMRYRYTEWVKFNYSSYKPDWQACAGVELYDLRLDPEGNVNHADDDEYTGIRYILQKALHAGWRSALH